MEAEILREAPAHSRVAALMSSAIAISWNLLCNLIFEAWESRQTTAREISYNRAFDTVFGLPTSARAGRNIGCVALNTHNAAHGACALRCLFLVLPLLL